MDKTRQRLSPSDRAFLAALLHRLPLGVLHRLSMLMRPDTVLRGQRDLLARSHVANSRPNGRADHAPSAPSAPWCCA